MVTSICFFARRYLYVLPLLCQVSYTYVFHVHCTYRYDKQHLVHWLKEIGNVSPVTLQSVASSQFIPNLAIKQQIEEYSTIQRQYDKLKFSRSFSSLSPSHSAASCVRLLLIGDCGVGKTSIKKYIEFDRMTIDPSYVRPTIGLFHFLFFVVRRKQSFQQLIS